MKSRRIYLLYLFCGFLCALPILFDFLPFLSYFAYVPVLIAEYRLSSDTRKPRRRAYKRGLLFFLAYGLVTFYWFIELYPLDFVGLSNWASVGVVALAWLGIPLLQALVSAFVFWILNRLLAWNEKRKPLVFVLAVPSLFAFAEWCQTLTWAAVPWGRVSLTQTGFLPALQSASVWGPYGITFLILSMNALLALAVIAFRRSPKKAIACAALAVAVFGGNLTFGLISMSRPMPTETVRVAAVQGNFDPAEKMSASIHEICDRYQQLTEDAVQEGAELIVWPESALTCSLETSPNVIRYLESLSGENQIVLLAGAVSEKRNGVYSNSVFLVTPENGISDTVYDKRHIVPFGEYMPMRTLFMTILPFLDNIHTLSTDLTPGTFASVFETPYGKVGSLVCFDSIFESLARESVREGAQLIAISTNDAWFGTSSAAYQHNRQAVLRAVENRRYVVRAANTGISSVISPCGEVLGDTPLFEPAFVVSDVGMISDITLYTRFGDWILYVSALILLASTADGYIQKKHRKVTHEKQET